MGVTRYPQVTPTTSVLVFTVQCSVFSLVQGNSNQEEDEGFSNCDGYSSN